MPPQFPPIPTTGLTFRSGVFDLESIEAHMSNMMKNTGDTSLKPLSEPPPKAKDTTMSASVSSFLAAAAIPTTPVSNTAEVASPKLPPQFPSSPNIQPTTPLVQSSITQAGRKEKNHAKGQTRQLHTRSPEAQRAHQKLKSNGSLAGMKFVPKQPSPPSTPTPKEDEAIPNLQHTTSLDENETPEVVKQLFASYQELKDADVVESKADRIPVEARPEIQGINMTP